MVRIIIIILLSVQFCYSQISNSQFYFGRGLDSAAILNSDIADSSITFSKIKFINPSKLLGNPNLSIDSIQEITVGTGLVISNDSLNAIPGGTGDVHQGGDSYSGDMILGTNDNNLFALQTNGVYRTTISSGATTGGEITATSTTTNTNTFNNALTIRGISTGTAAAGFGSSILFQGESSTTNHRDMIRLAARWETATDASRGAYLGIETVTGAGAILQRFKFTESGVLSIGSSSQALYSNSSITTAANFTIGASSSLLTLGNSTGRNQMISSAANINANLIDGTNISYPCLTLGATNYTHASLLKDMLYTNPSYTASSGGGNITCFRAEPVLNLTGTNSGEQIGLMINPTLTSLTAAKFYAIQMTNSHANSWGIYQSGTAKNVFSGKVTIGVNAAPTACLMLAAGMASANGAPLKFTSGTNLTTPETGAVEYDGSNLYFSDAAAIRFTMAKMLSGSARLDFGNTAAGTSDDLTVTITGAADGDEVVLGVPNAAMNASSSYFAWVSATNTVTVRHNNYSTGTINPTSAQFKISVIKR